MNRYKNTRSTNRLFMPSVGEVWSTASGHEILLYEAWEEGFRAIGYNHDSTLNFNSLPSWWFDTYKFVKTIDAEEMAKVVKSSKDRGWT